MQIKTTMRYHLTPDWTLLESLRLINAAKSVEKRKPSYTADVNVNQYSYYGKRYEDHLKSKNRVVILSSNPTPGYIFGDNFNLKRQMHSIVHSSIVYNHQDMEKNVYLNVHQPMNGQIGFETHYCLTLKKNGIMPFAPPLIDLEMITLSEVSQKDKYYMISHICGI